MEKQILEIVKQKDEYPYSVEVSQNAKGEVQITCKIRSEVHEEAKLLPETISLMMKDIALRVKEQGFKVAGEAKPELEVRK